MPGGFIVHSWLFGVYVTGEYYTYVFAQQTSTQVVGQHQLHGGGGGGGGDC